MIRTSNPSVNRFTSLAAALKIVEQFLDMTDDRVALRAWPSGLATPPTQSGSFGGASIWAKQLVAFAPGLRFATYAWFVQLALIEGSVGVLVAPFGKLSRALTFTFAGDKVTRVDVIGDPARLRELEIVAL